MKILHFMIGAFFSAAGVVHCEEVFECHQAAMFLAAPDSPDYRKYAPSREIDILHLAIDVTPDFTNRTVSGFTTISFKPIARPLESLSLDAVDLNIGSVTSSEPLLNHQVEQGRLILNFSSPVPADKESWVKIGHSAEPARGMYFRTPEMGYKPGETHLFTQGEAIEARHWYPCFDAPNEKFTSEITCHAPEEMTVLSNGRLVSETKDASTGLVATRWRQDKPHVNYLISLVAGNFRKIEDRHGDIPLAFYTLPSAIDEATNSFRDTKDMLKYFETETGVPYPWAKYYQVCVNDFVAGGMENTSISTLTDGTLFTSATENIRSSEGLVAHELAHQWFGDLVTCKDWSQIWLNEGFASYYTDLYHGHKHGNDSMLYGLYASAQRIAENTNARPMISRSYDQPMEMFNYLAYQKGAWVLHMLRSQLGPDLFRRCVRTYLERHEFASVTTEDLNSVVEELSGRSFDQFFDQWVYRAGVPELEVNYAWDARSKLARVSVRQTQRISEEIPLFKLPFTVRFTSQSGSVDKHVVVSQRAEDFYFALTNEPQIVRIDPDLTLLARINFNPPAPMLHAQLENTADALGRIIAVESIGRRRDRESIGRLKRALNNDAFYGVRIEAAQALRSIGSEEALDALIASVDQSDARVRRQVYQSISGFYHPRSAEATRSMLAKEKNPDIQSIAIRDLGSYKTPEGIKALLSYLNSTSYRNTLADAAIGALRAQSDPAAIPPLLENLKTREADYPSLTFGRGLAALAYLARDQDDKTSIREFLLSHVNHRKRSVQLAAINALGVLGDDAALPALEKISRGRKDSPEQLAATRAIQSIGSMRRPVEGLGELRQEILNLQRENRELRQQFEALDKKFKALPSPAEPAARSRPPVRSPRAR